VWEKSKGDGWKVRTQRPRRPFFGRKDISTGEKPPAKAKVLRIASTREETKRRLKKGKGNLEADGRRDTVPHLLQDIAPLGEGKYINLKREER